MSHSLTDDDFAFDPDIEMNSTDEDFLMTGVYDDIESSTHNHTKGIQGDYLHLETAYTSNPDSLTNTPTTIPREPPLSRSHPHFMLPKGSQKQFKPTLTSKGRESSEKQGWLKIGLVVAFVLILGGLFLFLHEQSYHQQSNTRLVAPKLLNAKEETSVGPVEPSNPSSPIEASRAQVITGTISTVPPLPPIIHIHDPVESGEQAQNEEYTSVMKVDPILIEVDRPEELNGVEVEVGRIDPLIANQEQLDSL